MPQCDNGRFFVRICKRKQLTSARKNVTIKVINQTGENDG